MVKLSPGRGAKPPRHHPYPHGGFASVDNGKSEKTERPAEIFNKHVFSQAAMAERLPREVFDRLRGVVEGREKLDIHVAGIVAMAMARKAHMDGLNTFVEAPSIWVL